MNRDQVLFHLQEAAEELNRTIADFERDAEFSEPELTVAMQHLLPSPRHGLELSRCGLRKDCSGNRSGFQ
jgi:hypothetical protein